MWQHLGHGSVRFRQSQRTCPKFAASTLVSCGAALRPSIGLNNADGRARSISTTCQHLGRPFLGLSKSEGAISIVLHMSTNTCAWLGVVVLTLAAKIIDYANRAKKDSNTARWLSVALAGNEVASAVVQIGTKHAAICEGAYKKLAQMHKDNIKDASFNFMVCSTSASAVVWVEPCILRRPGIYWFVLAAAGHGQGKLPLTMPCGCHVYTGALKCMPPRQLRMPTWCKSCKIKDEDKYVALFNLLDKQFVMWAEHENIGKDMEKRWSMRDFGACYVAACAIRDPSRPEHLLKHY
jgi:hypothetical protein